MADFIDFKITDQTIDRLDVVLTAYGFGGDRRRKLIFDIKAGRTLSEYSDMKILREWLFREHCAVFAKKNGEYYIRFLNEDKMLLFLLEC